MERLYAVPSEELRVWSIWLTMIGDLADEWQRWLRAHIDLVTRLAEQLRAVEKASSQPKEVSQLEIIQSEMDPANIPSDVAEDQADIPGEIDDVHSETSEAKSEISMNGQATDATTVVPAEKSRVPVADEEGENGAEDATWMWPIGTPWEHLGMEDAVDEAPFERLPLPESEDEMRQFLKKFTHEATVYRSYYKHWKETADQAIKAVGCRTVMATYRVQGKDEQGRTKKPPPPKSVIVRRSRAAKTKSKRKKPARKAKGKSAATSEEAVPPSTITIADEEEADDAPPANPENSANEMTEEPSTTEEETTKKSEAEASEANELARTSNSQASVKTYESEPEVSDLVRDCARADEPVPYIFYSKAEPDIDIAIEHDDEVVIVEDTDRENIVGDYRRLFFNLTDKPCKGGKPWI